MTLAELTGNLPAPWPQNLRTGIREELLASNKTIVVLDDDPTGTQTVYGLPVLTRWSSNVLEEEFRNESPVFYILTNSRAYTPTQTKFAHQEIAQNLRTASLASKREFIVISRSDSTLRGHYPLEIDTLAEGLMLDNPLTLIIPFFQAGGRLTVSDTHYVVEGDQAIPAHLTPFAEDNAFPFSHSHLPSYIEEKTMGQVSASGIASISLELIRTKGPEDVRKKLLALPPGSTCIVNATELADLEVLAAALSSVEKERNILYRTAASFVQARAGLANQPLLGPGQLRDPKPSPNCEGGLIIVGSHVPRTSVQLDTLRVDYPDLVYLELDVAAALESPANVVPSMAQDLEQALGFGKTVVLATSRKRIDATGAKKNLNLSQIISDIIVSIVKSLVMRPRFLLAKGGITSSTIATDALNVKRAVVLGQILPGVPVWTLGPETRFPALPYVIFPGNVGGDDALSLALEKLTS